MASFIKHVDVVDIQALTDDHTIGTVRPEYDTLEGDALFDLRRLREAIILFEEEYRGKHLAEIAIREFEVDGREGCALILIPENEGGATSAVALAQRVKREDGD